MNKKLTIADSTYGAILSARTFTHGHVGPNVLGELLRIVKPEGLFVISIHKNIFVKKGFKIISIPIKVKKRLDNPRIGGLFKSNLKILTSLIRIFLNDMLKL